jgi:hypothetical protein
MSDQNKKQEQKPMNPWGPLGTISRRTDQTLVAVLDQRYEQFV